MPFEPFDLARIVQNAEALKSMRSNAATEELQRQYLGQRMQNDQAQESRAAAQESRSATEFSQEQQLTNTKLLNMAAAEVATNPAAAARWDPIIKAAIPGWESVKGDPAQIQASARKLYDSTTAALQAHQASMTQGSGEPTSVREYQFARQNGFPGSYQDWITAGGQSSRPSAVLEWEHYQKLIAEDKKNGTHNAELYLEMKRAPNMQVRDINNVPSVVDPTRVGGTTTQPLSTQESERAAAEARKQAESRGAAVGAAEGSIQGGIQTKASNAVNTKTLIDMAEPLIDAATGSLAGAARDAFVKSFGFAPDSAQAISQLKVIQAGIMMNQPRMEGPQSNLDVKLYEQAAAQIGDPTVPAPIKKAALRTVEAIQNKYMERAGKEPAASDGGIPTITGDADYDKLPSGTKFTDPEGKIRVKP